MIALLFLSLMHAPPLLAQQESLLSRVAPWCAALLIASVALSLGAFWLRRRLAAQDDSEPLTMGFSLSDLRAMHTRGELTDQEYEHAKGRMVARTRAGLADESAPAGSSQPDQVIQPDAAERADGPPDSASEGDSGIRWEDPSGRVDDDDIELGPDFAPGADPDTSR